MTKKSLNGWPLLWLGILWTWSALTLNQLASGPVHFDAEHNYLPAARRLLDEGWQFFLDPESSRTAPLAFIWPALWGAQPQLIRLANSMLFMACILMLWQLGKLAGGARAALLATLLFVAHPELITYFPRELTEPTYVFGLILFLLSCATVMIEPAQSSSKRWIAGGALGLAMCLLARPVLQLIVPMLLAASLMVAYWPARALSSWRHIARSLSLILALGASPAILVIIKNGLVFDLWALGTGAGTGLYLGVHPLTQGTEPAFLGMDYDTNALAGLDPRTRGDHLNIYADALQRTVALSILRDMSLIDHVEYFGRKLWWWLFHHRMALNEFGTQLRAFRVFEIMCIATMGLLVLASMVTGGRGGVLRMWQHRDGQRAATATNESHPSRAKRMVVFLAAVLLIFVMLLSQLLLVLYNSRYSTGLLEPFLIVLCAASWGVLTRPFSFTRESLGAYRSWNWRVSAGSNLAIAGFLLGLLALVALPRPTASWSAKKEHPAIDPHRTGPMQPLLELDATTLRPADHIQRLDSGRWRLLANPAAIVIPFTPPQSIANPQHNYNDVWRFRFSVDTPAPSNCRSAEIGVTHPSPGRSRVPPFIALRSDGKMHDYLIHGTHNLRPVGPGDLRIAFRCPPGTEITWERASFLRSTFVQSWQYLIKDDEQIRGRVPSAAP